NVAALVLAPGPAEAAGRGEVPCQVGFEPVARLGPEGGVLRAVVEVHGWFRRKLPGRSGACVTLAKGSLGAPGLGGGPLSPKRPTPQILYRVVEQFPRRRRSFQHGTTPEGSCPIRTTPEGGLVER